MIHVVSFVRYITQQLLAAHVAWCAGHGTTRISAGPAEINVVEIAETVETSVRIIRIVAVEKRLTTRQHRMVEIAAGEQKEILSLIHI